MKYFDPSRVCGPNSWPCWLGHNVVLPTMDLRPQEDGDAIEARIMVGGKWFFKRIARDALPWLWRQWLEDPERCALEIFGAWEQDLRWRAPRVEPDGPSELGL